jgi:uncharacterized protein involved in propanediol utilization
MQSDAVAGRDAGVEDAGDASCAGDRSGPGGGVGAARYHHGEILQGALVHAGQRVPCLITLPVGGAGSTARYTRASSGQMLEVMPAWKKKAGRAARLALAHIGAAVAGRLEIECSVTTGVGLGSSTCDVVAAIRAVCGSHAVELDAGQVARLAIEAEGAADPIMFDEMVLFAQRHGRVLESFGSWVPRYTVLSIDTDTGAAGVDTLTLPLPDYTDTELRAFQSMVERARKAFGQRDPVTIAAIATESATLNQRFLPLRRFHEICEVAAEHGALGVQIAHSGTLAGILFDARAVPAGGDLAARAVARIRGLGVSPLGVFTTGDDPERD